MTLHPFTAGDTISLGGASGPTTLGLSDAALGQVTASVLNIGSGSQTGPISIDGNITTHAGYNTLTLLAPGAGGTIVSTGSNTLTVSNLILNANSGIGTAIEPLATVVSKLEGDTGGGNIFIDNTGNLAIGGLSGANDGLRANGAGSNLQLINQGSISVIVPDDVVRASANVTVDALGAASDVQTGAQSAFNAIRSAVSGITTVQAGRDIVLGNATSFGSIVSAAGSTAVTAGRDLIIDFGSRLSVDGGSGDVTALAGRNITLQATGGITGAHVTNSGSGSATLTTGAGGTFTATSGATADVQTTNGNITINADDMALTDTSSLGAGTGIVTLQQVSTNRVIDLGTDSPGNLGLTDAELTHVSTTNGAGLQIGATGATFIGGVNVSAAISNSANYNNTLSLRSAGPFSGTGGSLAPASLLLTDGATTGHTWTINASNVTEAPNSAIPFTSTSLTVTGGTGSDTFNVTPSAGTTFTINGNDPIPPSLPGDALNVDLTGTTSPSLTATSTASGFQGSFSFGNRDNVNFTQIESGIASPPSVTKVFGTSPILLNGTTSLTFTIQNPNTDLTLTGIAFTDILPAGVVVDATPGLSNGCGGTPTATAGSGSVSLSGGSLAASSLCTVSVTIEGTTTGVKNNMVTVTSTEGGLGNTSTASLTVNPVADLAVTKNGTASVVAGNNITYTVTVTNNGPSDAQTVSLTDPTPANTTFVSEGQTSGPMFNCTTPSVGGTGNIVCTIASFVSGDSATFSIVDEVSVATTGGTTITNSANATTATADTTTSNNTGTASTDVTPAPIDLSITKTASAPPYITGQFITYTIVAQNGGPAPATSVVVTDVIPAGTSFSSATPTQGSCSGTSTVTCSLGTIASSGSATVSLVLKLRLPQPVSNTATVSSANPDTNTTNNSASARIVAVEAPGIPALSSFGLLLLALILMFLGASRLRL